jgi:hypothetical protein
MRFRTGSAVYWGNLFCKPQRGTFERVDQLINQGVGMKRFERIGHQRWRAFFASRWGMIEFTG